MVDAKLYCIVGVLLESVSDKKVGNLTTAPLCTALPYRKRITSLLYKTISITNSQTENYIQENNKSWKTVKHKTHDNKNSTVPLLNGYLPLSNRHDSCDPTNVRIKTIYNECISQNLRNDFVKVGLDGVNIHQDNRPKFHFFSHSQRRGMLHH